MHWGRPWPMHRVSLWRPAVRARMCIARIMCACTCTHMPMPPPSSAPSSPPPLLRPPTPPTPSTLQDLRVGPGCHRAGLHPLPLAAGQAGRRAEGVPQWLWGFGVEEFGLYYPPLLHTGHREWLGGGAAGSGLGPLPSTTAQLTGSSSLGPRVEGFALLQVPRRRGGGEGGARVTRAASRGGV